VAIEEGRYGLWRPRVDDDDDDDVSRSQKCAWPQKKCYWRAARSLNTELYIEGADKFFTSRFSAYTYAIWLLWGC